MNSQSIILGTAQFSGSYGLTNERRQFSIEEVTSILTLATKNKITRFDTAISYPGVYSILSKALLAQSEDPIKLATKFAFKGISSEKFYEQLQFSRDYFPSAEIEIVFVHDWNDLDQLDFRTIKEISKGFPEIKLGVSIYEPQDLKEISESAISFSVMQIPFSVLNQSFVPYLPRIEEKGIEIWTRSLFLQGAIDWNSYRNTFADHPSIVKLKKLGEELNASPFEIALDFVKEFSLNSVIGVATSSQLGEIINILDLPSFGVDYKSFASTDKRLIDPREW
jgi:aryl-alcohol dehydrogenase-like predicted oxidoreductase